MPNPLLLLFFVKKDMAELPRVADFQQAKRVLGLAPLVRRGTGIEKRHAACIAHDGDMGMAEDDDVDIVISECVKRPLFRCIADAIAMDDANF